MSLWHLTSNRKKVSRAKGPETWRVAKIGLHHFPVTTLSRLLQYVARGVNSSLQVTGIRHATLPVEPAHLCPIHPRPPVEVIHGWPPERYPSRPKAQAGGRTPHP